MVLPSELLNQPKITAEDVEKYFRRDLELKRKKHNLLSQDWKKAVSETSISSSQDILHRGFNVAYQESYTFLTGSKYKGGWNVIGMAGLGNYVLPHGVEYGGELKESYFEGEGMLEYPLGDVVRGVWKKDKLISSQLQFADGLLYNELDWFYCRFPDRRFYRSIAEGMRPANEELITNDEEPRKIPEGCYDVGEGFYNPTIKCIVSATDFNKIIRIPSNAEEKWIMENCRKAWDEPIGYRPDLYEYWCNGKDSCDYPSKAETERDSLPSICAELGSEIFDKLSDVIDILTEL